MSTADCKPALPLLCPSLPDWQMWVAGPAQLAPLQEAWHCQGQQQLGQPWARQVMVSNAHKLAVSKTEVHWQLGCLHAVRMTTAFLACRCRRRIWGEGTGGTVCPLSAEAEQMGVMPLRGAHACRLLGTRLAAGEVRLPCPVACGVQSQPFPLALPMSDAAAMPLCLDRGEGASVSHMGWAPLAGPRVPHKVYACACRWTAPSQHCPPAAGVPAVAGRAAGWTCWPVVMQ